MKKLLKKYCNYYLLVVRYSCREHLLQKKERKEDKKMRTIIYSVVNKETNKKVYANCQVSKCEEHLAKLENKENFKIVYKWQSF
jgi:hypothetical protein